MGRPERALPQARRQLLSHRLEIPRLDLDLLEEAVWRAAEPTRPKDVASAVAGLRAAYVRSAPPPRPARAVLAKLVFYGVADAAKVGVVLSELAAASALPRADRWDVLDLGAGPGVTAIALAEWLRQQGLRPRLRVVAVDRDREALAAAGRLTEAYRQLAGEQAPTLAIEPVARDLERSRLPAGPFDLVLAGNLLGELFQGAADPALPRAALLEQIARSHLRPLGSICVIEPALRENARALHRVRDRLLDGSSLRVFAPCLRTAPCPMLGSPRDWCHEDRPAALPERTRLVARLAGLQRHRLKFSYLTLRLDELSLRTAFPEATFRVVSERLISKGRDELYVCGEQGRLRLLRNRRDRTEANRALDRLDRGRLMSLDPSEERLGPTSQVKAWDPVP